MKSRKPRRKSHPEKAARKPFVFSNLATSIDGKIATASREFFPLGSRDDLAEMIRLRDRSDVVLMGAATLRSYGKPCRGKKKVANAILTRAMEGMDPAWSFFRSDAIDRIFLLTASPTRRLRARIEREYGAYGKIVWLRDGLGARDALATGVAAVRALARKGYARILVEGGGSVMWDFARDDLIDEYHVTIAPRVLGGTEAPTLVDGEGLDPTRALNLELKSVRKRGSELFLVYRSLKRRGKKHPLLAR